MGRPRFLELRSSNLFILFTVSFAVFTDIFLYAVIVPVMPFSLISRAHVPEEKVGTYISALVAAYGGALAAVSPIFGYLADHTKTRRSPFVLGLVVLAAATLMLHLGNTFALLVVARILQGISAAVVWIVGLALLADTISKDEVGHAMGYVFLGMSLGILLGPVLGGVVFDKLGYDAVFIMAYCMIAIDIILRLVAIEKKVAREWLNGSATESPPQIDLQETTSVDGVELPNMEELNDRTISPRRLPSFLFLLRSPSFLASLWGSVVLAILMTAFDAVLPLYVKNTFDWTSLGAGLLFLAVVLPSFLGPLIGIASDKYGRKWFATIGFLLAVPIEVLFRLVTHNTLSQKVILVVLLFLLGLSTTLIITPLTAELTLVAERLQRSGRLGSKGVYAQAYGLFNFAFAIGCLIGPLLGGLINKSAGWGTMTWSLGLLCGISAIPTAIWCGGPLFSQKND